MMRGRRLLAAALAAASATVWLTAAAGQGTPAMTRVKTRLGELEGVAAKTPGVVSFKGIPFAAPPVGDKRWRAPEPAPSWSGVRKADRFSASCIQQIVSERKPWTYEFMAHGEVSEDCLYLNVWTPARAASDRRPVFVYIYGGANNEGSASVPVYDGEGLASKGLVVVTINYRVGIMGFFAHPELSAEASYHASGNYGLLDQIAAVRWVHDHIAAFGGDPARITVAGQSAGAAGVHNLTASPLAKGLFHRAIAQSGSSIGGPVLGGRTLADIEADGVKFAAAKQAANLAALRKLTWQELTAPVAAPAPAAGGRGPQGFRFTTVVVDGYALDAPVRQVFTEGRQHDVPTLTGLNADENGAVPNPTITLKQWRTRARERFGAQADEFLALYPASSDEEARRVSNESARDQARVSMYLWAAMRARTAKTRAFTYYFDHKLPGPDIAQYGAFHTSEVPYALNTLAMSDRPFTDADRRIADAISSYWVHFAESGDPNGKGLPAWPAVSTDAAMTMEIGDAMRAIPVASTPERLAFFRRLLTAPPSTAAAR